MGRIDAVLLSHDQHLDNLDRSGRRFLTAAPVIFSTSAARPRLDGRVVPVDRRRAASLDHPTGGRIEINGTGAQHGPDGSEHLVGDVTGFVLTGDGLPTVYVSGDNASLALALVSAVAERPTRRGRLGRVDGPVRQAVSASPEWKVRR